MDEPTLSFFDLSYPNSTAVMENFFIYDNVQSLSREEDSVLNSSSSSSMNDGMRYLVLQALFNSRLPSSSICSKQITCHIIITCLAALLSPFENRLLCLLLKVLINLFSGYFINQSYYVTYVYITTQQYLSSWQTFYHKKHPHAIGEIT